MSRSGVAVDAAMLTSSIDVDACIESYIGAVVVGD